MGIKPKQNGRSSDSGRVHVQIGDGAQLSNNVIKVSGGAMHEGFTTPDPSDTPDTLDTPSAAPNPQTLDLFRTLSSRFNLEELGTVCWELGIKFEDLPAQTLSGKARQLVEKAAALSLTEQLQEIVGRERPGVV